jgi:hypothetical protein
MLVVILRGALMQILQSVSFVIFSLASSSCAHRSAMQASHAGQSALMHQQTTDWAAQAAAQAGLAADQAAHAPAQAAPAMPTMPPPMF